jgi:NADH-quinone oxidoreductase subunit N
MTPNIEIGALAPMLPVAIAVVVLPVAQVVLSRTRRFLSSPVTERWASDVISLGALVALAISLFLTVQAFGGGSRVFNLDNPMILTDRFAHFLNATVLIAALMTVLVSNRFLSDMEINHGEYYALLLSSVTGMLFLTSATDLMMLFLALELTSIPLYVLAGFRRDSLRSNEAALKYFLIGSFASGILLYGAALLYGATGSIALAEVATRFDPESPVAVLGAGLLLVGLAFKIAAVPFHQWAPDVYEGAPTTVTAFMATAVKVAGFGVLLRVLVTGLYPTSELLYGALWVMAVLTMTVGNIMAIVQSNAKRMLAYSSVAHAGYALVGVTVATQVGYSAVLFYLLVYTFTTIAAFTVIAVLAQGGRERERINDLAGLGVRRPFIAAVMAIAMFSLAGIPGTAGFMGKFYVFRAAVERGTSLGDPSLIWLAILGVLNSALSLVYYLRIPMVMYMQEPSGAETHDTPGSFEALVLVACAMAILAFGIWPENLDLILGRVDLLRWATVASASLLP